MATLLALISASCSKRNPDICCDSAAECSRAGLDPKDGLAPCDDGVCVAFSCVASGCDDDGDCHDPAHPTCMSGKCYGAVDACLQGGGARIVFFSYRDNANGLYSMYVNGTGQKRITDDAISDDLLGGFSVFRPAISISPDGSLVAFAGGEEPNVSNIFTIGADGTDRKQITSGSDPLSHVEWSPDGMKMLVSTPTSGGVAKASVMRADGSHLLSLTGYVFSNYDPSWSPDSTKIVFASTDGSSDAAIWTAKDNATSPISLDSISIGASFYRPRWSPDGSTVGYLSTENGRFDLVLKKLSDTPGHLVPGIGNTVDFRWSHDSTRLLVTRQLGIPGLRSIWLMDADGTNQRQLADETTDSGNARWSPDDQSILFDTNRDGNTEIYRMDADGSNPGNLTNAPGMDDDPFDDRSAEWASCPSS